MSAPLVIVGTGHAGYTLAREWRRLQPGRPLVMLTRDDGHSYYKPDLSKAFASGKDAEGLIKARVEAMAKELDASIHPATEVVSIDPAAHTLRCRNTGDFDCTYSTLVLATGAQPIRLPVAGDAAADIHRVNDRLDYARFRDGLADDATVLIIGAGLVGCEWANDMAAHGFRVHVVDLAAWPLARLLPEPTGRALQAALSELGVRWHLQASLQSLDRAGARLRARLADGRTLEVDRVLSAVGLRPDTTLARAAGLACAQGIQVDAFMRTSHPDIHALGDCVEIDGRPLPYILPIAHAARALARTLAGTPTPARFPPMPVQVKTPACPIVVCPPAAGPGAWSTDGAAPDFESVFRDSSGQATGFALSGAATARRGALTAIMPAAAG